VPFGERYFDIAAPEIAPGSLVIVGYAHPMAYAAPFFRPDARFVSPQNNFMGLEQKNLLARRAAGIIDSHQGPLYLLEHRTRNGHDRRMLERFALASDEGACVPVPSSFDVNEMRICRLARK
jgi:hypothetical protein